MELHDTETVISLWNMLAQRTNVVINLFNQWQKDDSKKDAVYFVLVDLEKVEEFIISSEFSNSIFLDSLNEIKEGLRLTKILLFSKSLTQFDMVTKEAFTNLVAAFEDVYPNRILANPKTKEIWLTQDKGK